MPLILYQENISHLAQNVAALCKLPSYPIAVSKFKDGESRLSIDANLAKQDVILLHKLYPEPNHSLVEMLLTIDACKQANSITVLTPYLCYARQDKITTDNTPSSLNVIATILSHSGIKQLITIDIHSASSFNYFSIPLHNLPGLQNFKEPLLEYVFMQGIKESNLSDQVIIVSPDLGGTARARKFADTLTCNHCISLEKYRDAHNTPHLVIAKESIHASVQNKICIIVDDIVDTAGTLINAANMLKQQGAKQVIACCTHAILSGNALDKIASSSLDKIFVSNSIASPKHHKLQQVDLTTFLADELRKLL